MAEKETQTTDQPLQEQDAAEQDLVPAAEEQAETGAQNTAQTTAGDDMKKQLEEAKNKYLYLLSDFENFKRNTARERMELIQTAGRDLMTLLLPVLDDFDRAAKNDGLPDGIQLIHQKLLGVLQSKGLKTVDLKAGDPFNADLQEAVAEIPAPSEEAKGNVVDVLEPGYLIGDRIIRYAKVVVGK